MGRVRPEIVEALTHLGRGDPCALLVELDTGTRAADAFAELRSAARGRTFGVVAVAPVESDQLSTRSRLLWALSGSDAVAGSGGAVADRTAELLDSMSQNAPVVVIVEQAHWSDPGTLTALRTLPELLAHLPILWAVGVEPDNRRAELVVESMRRLRTVTVVAERAHDRPLVGTPVALLQVGSVIGIEFDLDVAARVLGRSVGSLLDEIQNAMAAGVLTESGAKLRFADAQFRNRLYDALPSAVRRSLHYEVAAEMVWPGTEAEAVWHLARSTSRLTDDDLGRVRGAISRLAAVAPGDAAELAFQVGDLYSPSDRHHIEFVTTAAMHLANTSRIGEALSIHGRLPVGGVSNHEEARLRLVTAHLHQAAGDDTEAMSHLGRALALPELDAGLRLALLKAQAAGHVNLGQIDDAARVSGPILRSARSSPDPATRISAVLFASQLAFGRAQVTTALKLAEQAASGVEISATRPLHAPRIPELWLATVMLSSDRADEASDLLLDGQRHHEKRGLAWSAPYWHTTRAIERWMRDELDDAAAEAETALHAADRLDIVRPLQLARAVLAIVETDRGNVARARRLLDRTVLSPRPRPYDIWTAAALVRLAPDAAGGARRWLLRHANLARLMSLPPKLWAGLPSPTGHEPIQDLLSEIGRTARDQQVVVSAVATATATAQGHTPAGPRPGPDGGASRGWDGLTASELRVARLVVGGRTNRGIAEQLHVSVHTVGTHLRHVFAKLDINTRVELTRLALQHGVVPDDG